MKFVGPLMSGIAGRHCIFLFIFINFSNFFFQITRGCGAPLRRGALCPGTMGTMGSSALTTCHHHFCIKSKKLKEQREREENRKWSFGVRLGASLAPIFLTSEFSRRVTSSQTAYNNNNFNHNHNHNHHVCFLFFFSLSFLDFLDAPSHLYKR